MNLLKFIMILAIGLSASDKLPQLEYKTVYIPQLKEYAHIIDFKDNDNEERDVIEYTKNKKLTAIQYNRMIEKIEKRMRK